MQKRLFLTAAILLTTAFQPFTAEARDTSKCDLKKNITLNINLGNTFIPADEVGTYITSRIAEVETLAKDAGVEKIFVQNMNYNVNSYKNNNYNQPPVNGQFRLNGSINFQIQGEKEPTSLLKALDEKGYNVNFRVNANRQCR